MGVSRVLMHISMFFKNDLRVFHWCLKIFLSRLLGCFNGVSKVFPGCF